MILPFLIAWLASRITQHQDHIIRYLREENRLLKARLKGKRLQLTDTERRRLAVLAHPIDRTQLNHLSTLATPDTLRRWHRRLVDRAPSPRLPVNRIGRPRVESMIEQLVVRMATENPRWGYRRIQGALSNIGHHMHHTTVRNILRRNHLDPAPIRAQCGMSWSQFMKIHLEMVAASGGLATLWVRAGRLWALFCQSGRILSACDAQWFRLIHHGTISILAFVVHHCQGFGSRGLSAMAMHSGLPFVRCQHVSTEAYALIDFMSFPRMVCQSHCKPLGQERSPPPSARPLAYWHAQPPPLMTRMTSSSYLTAVSHVEGCWKPGSHSRPWTVSGAASSPPAA